jgi:hypothetical protein
MKIELKEITIRELSKGISRQQRKRSCWFWWQVGH